MAGSASDSTATRAVRAAEVVFLAGERVKMQELAEQLGVTRMTLNRAVGTRHQFLGLVLWALSEPLIRECRAAVPGHGARPLATALGLFIRRGLDSEALRAFIDREPTVALAVLTTTQSSFQASAVALIAELVEEDVAAGALEPPLEIADLAYAVVRLLESFTYADLITGGRPDPVKAEQAVFALLS